MKILSLLLIGIWSISSCQTQPSSNIESSSTQNRFIFLDSIAAAIAITQDKKEGFFEKIGQLDMEIQMSQACKVSRDKFVVQYKQHLAEGVLSFTPDEKQFMQKVMEKAYKICHNLSPNIFPDQIKLIKTNMNHYGPSVYYTRENCIIIPQNVLMTQREESVLETMLHEIFHIYSRYNVDKKNKLYETIGYTKVDNVKIPKRLKNRLLLNPDGIDFLYKIKNLSTERNQNFEAVPLLYTRVEEYDNDNALFFTYLKFNLFELKDGKVITEKEGASTLKIEEVQNFFEQIGQNTDYIIHPDEVLADNFIFLTMWRAGEKTLADFDIKETGKQLILDIEKILLK